ncbi:tRNA (adenosine(37)-N6)-threonylcarbamoyltransferase complex ATPase subunit type 1 TsaE [Candidatus Sumerlaeota bacterium]|nr:tRNA (adenosine(37)-N6)-threonylcarbamoyltransferase complex ATPase subunit type 1 TsaE [Candidatus Sumerlaeota bacterium]
MQNKRERSQQDATACKDGKAKAIRARTDGEAQTERLGELLGEGLHEPARLALRGVLGAGKTAFIRGVARGLGVQGAVNSPSYVLIKTYRGGRLILHHCDWHRHRTESDIVSSGFDDLEIEPAVIAVEWAEKFPGFLQPPMLWIEIQTLSGDIREITLRLEGSAPALREALQHLAAAWDAEQQRSAAS